jgi:Co/Zn/Cd efflux system component
MPGGCCDGACSSTQATDERGWRLALWIALVVNAAMFAVEIGAGVAADSQALKADALDFIGDAANYAISLAVAGMALAARARAALLKGATLVVFGVWVLGSALWAMISGAQPEPVTMSVVGVLALVANVGVAAMLYRFRDGDSNRRSVWICSRNDAIGNLAVVAAAAGVFGTGTAWPDLAVAGILATLGVVGGIEILRHAREDLRSGSVANRLAQRVPSPVIDASQVRRRAAEASGALGRRQRSLHHPKIGAPRDALRRSCR